MASATALQRPARAVCRDASTKLPSERMLQIPDKQHEIHKCTHLDVEQKLLGYGQQVRLIGWGMRNADTMILKHHVNTSKSKRK